MSIPPIKWYQTLDEIIIHVSSNNSKNDHYQFKLLDNQLDNQLFFNNETYTFTLNLLHPVKIKSSIDLGRTIKCVLSKISETPSSKIWSNLTLDRNFNKTHVSIDWNNWKDLEEELEDDVVGNNFSEGVDMDSINQMMKQMGNGNVPEE